jgi:tRNA dimethylallyltransferase
VSGAERVIEAARAAPERLVCIVGPTASGKTALAFEVCRALNGEVISADSVQIYRGFDIGSGKPTPEELAEVPHRMVSTHDPLAPVDAATWARLALAEIDDVRARGKVPIVCGGTFFWVRALVLGLADAPSGDPAIRERHRAFAQEHGRPALHALLAETDPECAKRLHPNDVVRVSRALEVFELSGRRMSSFQEEHGFRARRFDAAMFALRHEPDVLTTRIAARVDEWLRGAWIDEVKGLLAAGYAEARAMKSVGYAEVHAHLAGQLHESELAPAIVRATRVFARRQRTWLNHADIEWL